LSRQLGCIPPHIETLSFSDSQLLGLSVFDFIEVLPHLPPTIKALDFSDNSLWMKTTDELRRFFCKIPATMKTLILKQNNLSSLTGNALKKALSFLPPSITELDLSENGLDSLPPALLGEILHAIPDTVKRIILDKDKFGIRNDGALVPYAHAPHPGLFKPQGIIRHQIQFISLQLVMMQMVRSGIINLALLNIILPHLVKASEDERADLSNKMAITLISSTPPTNITPAVRRECLGVVQQRIHALTTVQEGTKLDLSRCGLNRLNKTKLGYVFGKIPKKSTSISLRGNGLQYDEDSRKVFIAAMKKLPRQISYIDLSDNGFEHNSAEELKQLFIHFPTTCTVSLSHEKPLSPAEHIAKKTFPNSYEALTAETRDILQQARILLNDYTKDNSSQRRFFHGHWNRHYVKEVAKLVHAIDKGLITNLDNLLSEFDRINMPYETGSLGRRLAFLCEKASSKQTRDAEDNNVEEERDSNEVEMRRLT
jgi:Leucine-rich repeat (LRR) protein